MSKCNLKTLVRPISGGFVWCIFKNNVCVIKTLASKSGIMYYSNVGIL